MNNAYVLGVGLTKFGRFPERTVESLAAEAVVSALEDAGVEWREVEQFYAAHVNQGVAAGQRVVKEIGPSGIPVLNVENCSAAASTALREASLAVRSGEFDLVVVAGFEKMQHGVLLNVHPEDSPEVAMGTTVLPMRFSLMAMEHMSRYGTTVEQFAKVTVKNRDHAVHNPKAQYPSPITLERVLESRMISDPITIFQCSPTTDGAAAAVVCSEDYLRRKAKHARRAVRMVASGLASDVDELAFNRFNLETVRRNARTVYEKAGLGPEDLDVVETHDCFSVAELLAYESLGLCAEGESGKLIDDGSTRIGGRLPVNPSGGLIGKGHPLGATGLSQVAEIVTQLRGEAGARQVEGAKVGLTSNMGMWSSCIHMLAI
ncbi:thiolase C-terminal domain-containing protein [Ramlibacter sp.]|uniref:thiolase C-terminal domain-containing protein n=1 Tax=Ramlibacter sp. TaxID=1917967 RepID=UPI002FC71A4E